MINIIDKSVGGVLVSYDWSKVLIIRTDHHYGFPKGHIENNETEVTTMKREIKEEIGLELTTQKILGRFQITFPIYNTNITRIIVCYLLNYNENIPLNIQTCEIDEARWVCWKEALELFKNSKQYLILLESIKLSIIYKFKIKNIFKKIKSTDRIIIEHPKNYNNIDSHTIDNELNCEYIKYYLGSDILIQLFINNININELTIYKLNYIPKIYHISNKKYNLDYIKKNYNGLELKNNIGFIWNLNIIEKISLL
jgi:bis(5'-nucleosidyl)-tetraphosphatase